MTRLKLLQQGAIFAKLPAFPDVSTFATELEADRQRLAELVSVETGRRSRVQQDLEQGFFNLNKIYGMQFYVFIWLALFELDTCRRASVQTQQQILSSDELATRAQTLQADVDRLRMLHRLGEQV